MSQHTITTSKIHKTLTAVAVALLLAAPFAAPALASANGNGSDETTTSSNTGTDYDASGYRAFPKKKDRSDTYPDAQTSGISDTSSSDGGNRAAPEHQKPLHDSSYKDKPQEKDKGYAPSDGGYDKKDDYKKDDDRDYPHKKWHDYDDKPKHEPAQPVKPVEKVIEKTEVIHHKPTEVRQEVSQNVNQETNVVVQRETVERPVVHEKVVREVVKQPTVQKPVVHKPAVAAAVTEPKPVVVAPAEAAKGELEETGADAKTNTLAGLGLLGSLGVLGILTRRKAPARN